MRLKLDKVEVILPYIPLEFKEGFARDESTYVGVYSYTLNQGVTLSDGTLVKLQGLLFHLTLSELTFDNLIMRAISLDSEDNAHVRLQNIKTAVSLGGSTVTVVDNNNDEIEKELTDAQQEELFSILDINDRNDVHIYYNISRGLLS